MLLKIKLIWFLFDANLYAVKYEYQEFSLKCYQFDFPL